MPSYTVRASDLRHSVTIQAQTTTVNAYGEANETWTDVITLNALVRPLYGREYVESRIIESEVTHKVVIRYYPNLTTKHRILFGTRYFHIETIMNVDERNRVLELMCVEYDT